MTVRLTTDASCGGDGFQEAAIAVAAPSALAGRAPTALTDACTSGGSEASIGTIVVVPSDADDDAFAVRVVAGIGVPTESCPAPDYVLGPEDTAAGRGCIVARRSLAFLPHTPLELPIVLRQSCLNVDCDEDATCVDGVCISARVDPDKCAEPGGCSEDDLVGGAGGSGGAGGAGGAGGLGGAGGIGGTGGTGGGGNPVVTSLTVGESFSCALADGVPVCWGLNENGVFGIGTVEDTGRPPVQVFTAEPLPAPVVELDAGAVHLCARLVNGLVYCAGDNQRMQLGSVAYGAASVNPQPVPTMFAQRLMAGDHHGCTAADDVTPYLACWGHNDNGQVEFPETPGVPQFWEYDGYDVTDLAGGPRHTCAVHSDSGVTCWGDGTFFQVGQGNSPSYPPSIVLQSGGAELEAAAVSAGAKHSCAIDTNANVRCWGTEDDPGHQFGDGFNPTGVQNLATPNGVTNAARISTGTDATCVVTTLGELRCWGSLQGPDNIAGPGNPAWQPTVIATAADVVDVAVGENHACYLDVLDDVYCWGDNSKGQSTGVEGGSVWPPTPIDLTPGP